MIGHSIRIFLLSFFVVLTACHATPKSKVIDYNPVPVKGHATEHVLPEVLKKVCVGLIDFYKNEKFEEILSEDEKYAKLKQTIRKLVGEKLTAEGFLVDTCTAMEEKYPLDLAIAHTSGLFGIFNNQIHVRVRVHYSVKFHNTLLFDAVASEPIYGSNDASIQATSTKLANALVKILVEKLLFK